MKINGDINNGKNDASHSLLSILQERKKIVQSLQEKKMLSQVEIALLEKFGILEGGGK